MEWNRADGRRHQRKSTDRIVKYEEKGSMRVKLITKKAEEDRMEGENKEMIGNGRTDGIWMIDNITINGCGAKAKCDGIE